MKNIWHVIVLSWIISFWGGYAYGEVQPFETELPMTCGDTNNLVDGLRERYQEEIVMMAPSQNSVGDNLFHSLWINRGTGTWSFIVVNREKGLTCVIATGDSVQMFFPGDST